MENDTPRGAAADSGGLSALKSRLGGKPAFGDNDAGSEDARTCSILYDKSGERFREFRGGANLLEENEIPQWPLDGPRAVRWLMKYIAKYGGSPLGRHTKWLREAKIDDSDPAAFVHEVLSEFFELLLCYNMLDASSLACVERLARWYQDLEGQEEPAEAKGGFGC